MIIVYNTLLYFALIIGAPLLLLLIVFSEKRRKTVWPRLMRTPFSHWEHPTIEPEKSKNPLWVHALSVGEVLSAAPLLSGLKSRFPDRPVLLTVSTQTGVNIAREKLAALVSSIDYSPYDVSFSIKKAIRHINPALVLIVETDIWPNAIHEIKKRNIPVLLVNARLSENSYRGYRRFSFFFLPLFSSLSTICTQSATDARRFTELGVSPALIYNTGNMKYDQSTDKPDFETLTALRRRRGIPTHQPVIVAGSTHEGEEELLLTSLSNLKRNWPNLLLILAPRDPKRAAAVIAIATSMGLRATAMNTTTTSQPGTSEDVLVIDTMGMLRETYAIADIAFVGGSLVPFKGHNPLEPAAWSKPVLFGPDMRDFQDISNELIAAGGAIQLQNNDDFYKITARLLSDPRKPRAMGRRALETFLANGGAVEKILGLVGEHLGRVENGNFRSSARPSFPTS